MFSERISGKIAGVFGRFLKKESEVIHVTFPDHLENFGKEFVEVFWKRISSGYLKVLEGFLQEIRINRQNLKGNFEVNSK